MNGAESLAARYAANVSGRAAHVQSVEVGRSRLPPPFTGER